MGDALKVDSVFHYSPVTKDFAVLPPEELKDFFSYFIDNLPYCLDYLIQEIVYAFRASIDLVMLALETAHDWANCSAGICLIGTGE
ncbi:hypothetical protein [Pseudomonas abietaniphila]|uniref:hypothetical protein n=1 Tax=Pseudomonas abietaniphila TaxID=89065 RepID=UPI0011600096|nr:hypothetical protein [Pseudomonas abietaniphila]